MNIRCLMILLITPCAMRALSPYFTSSIEQIAGFAQELEQKLQELEDEFEQLNALPECDCNDQQLTVQDSIQELKNQMLLLNMHVERMQVELPCILAVTLSSNNDVHVFMQEEALCATCAVDGYSAHFTLEKGDHNLWYGDDGELWGYNKQGKLFVIDKDNKRSELTR